MNSTLLPGVSDARAVSYLVLLACVLPYLLSVIQQRHWSSVVRGRVTIALCALVSAGILWMEGSLTPSNWLTSAVLLAALTATIYDRFAKENGAATLETVTTAILRVWTGKDPFPSNDSVLSPPESEILPDEGEAPDVPKST